MAVYDYAETFARQLAQKYARELCSDALTKSNPACSLLMHRQSNCLACP